MKHLQNTDVAKIVETWSRTTSLVLVQPFDLAREQYAIGVRVGLFENSMLACARFGRYISSLEKITLGPWARQA